MLIMRELDPQGVVLRKSRQFCRRVYYSKVPNLISGMLTLNLIMHGDNYNRVPTSHGTLMVMISYEGSTFVYMVVLMG